MKLEKKYLVKCYHDAAILQYQDLLIKQGYEIDNSRTDYFADFKVVHPDLVATKENKKIFYEFKIIGKKEFDLTHISNLKLEAANNGAELKMVFINPIVEKNIEFEELSTLLFNRIIQDGIPTELDTLSSHTRIKDVYAGEITNINITRDEISIGGEATISVSLQYGSDGDCNRDIGLEENDSFSMTYSLKMDHGFDISDFQYDIDTSSFYQ